VDLWCYLEGGDRGPAKKECATACAKAGNPIGVLDAKGNLYVAAGLKDHQPAQALSAEQDERAGDCRRDLGQGWRPDDDLRRHGEVAAVSRGSESRADR